MSANADLATLLALLADYGRPTINQVSGSASPGYLSAGLWFCEVGIHGMGVEEARALPEAEQVAYWRDGMHVGARCVGSDMDPTEAARRCLAECQRMMESARGRFLRPVSVAQAIEVECARQKAKGAIR